MKVQQYCDLSPNAASRYGHMECCAHPTGLGINISTGVDQYRSHCAYVATQCSGVQRRASPEGPGGYCCPDIRFQLRQYLNHFRTPTSNSAMHHRRTSKDPRC
eukprot:gnl/TRDRNA2_/TRDRNA2_76613_c0_seq1.p2 gnl/TRDRNA2_/TRDRNA2_76613_c0~~gnl/TRDRNA2_/TRDRNA2_76613_c0_seq1.p2  ORF type:complete len:103 (-),score=9.72 gnl/TRDRNA2_/TRDRNA2_76613_c0_seq1:210-518(-)